MSKIEQISQRFEALERQFANVASIHFDNFQPLSFLKSIEIGETLKFDNGAISTKIKDDGVKMTFKVFMPKGCGLPSHWHDCHEELQVLHGRIRDKVLKKTIKAGEKMIIKKNTFHQPINPSTDEAVVLSVIFYE